MIMTLQTALPPLVTEILKIVVNVISVYQSPGNDNDTRSDDDSESEVYY